MSRAVADTEVQPAGGAMEKLLEILPFLLELRAFGGGRYIAWIGDPPYYLYLNDADEAVEALVADGSLTKLDGWGPPYIATDKIVAGGGCSMDPRCPWRRVIVTLVASRPWIRCMTCGADPTEGKDGFVEVDTAYGKQHILLGTVVKVEDAPSWSAYGNCKVTWYTGMSNTFSCTKEVMEAALGL